jgi:hypothetical protein
MFGVFSPSFILKNSFKTIIKKKTIYFEHVITKNNMNIYINLSYFNYNNHQLN